jgi:WhiB family transcriptional regulator, redox-sensing transcriptional regulator
MSTATLLTALTTDVGDWFDQGACVQDGADLFFARHGEPANGAREAQAKARCASCPVLADCREWALAAGDPSGVWAGGTSTAERVASRSTYSIAS